ncbi:RNA-binding transcriptional accessory protein, partial [Streptococcus suis]
IEALSEDVSIRSFVNREIEQHSLITSTLKDESLDEKKIYQIYYDFSEPECKMQGYRVLALNRGEKQGILKVHFEHNLDV